MDTLAVGRAESGLHWLVNGTRLSRQLGGRVIEETEPFRNGWALGPVLAYLDQLASPRSGEFSLGHTTLLVCEECGDLECGAITAAVDFDDTTVTWSDFRWQQRGGWVGVDDADPPITFTFDRDDYLHTIASLGERLALTARSEPWWRWRRRSHVRV